MKSLNSLNDIRSGMILFDAVESDPRLFLVLEVLGSTEYNTMNGIHIIVCENNTNTIHDWYIWNDFLMEYFFI